MSFFSKMISKRPDSETTSAAIKAAIANVKADHQRAGSALAAAEKSLLTPEELESPEALDEARRTAERLRGEVEFWAGRVTKLEADLVEAEKRDADAAFSARSAAAEKRAKAYPKTLARYEAGAPEFAAILRELATSRAEIASVNVERQRRKLPPIEIHGAHFAEPDVELSPERPIYAEKWVNEDGSPCFNQAAKGVRPHNARWARVQVGVTTAEIRRGRSIPAPEDVARLPAARIGQADFYRGPRS